MALLTILLIIPIGRADFRFGISFVAKKVEKGN